MFPVPADKIAGGLIAEMAPFGRDSLLEVTGVRAVHQHLLVVIRFQNNRVEICDHLPHRRGDAPRIREDPEPADDKAAGSDVMGGLHRSDVQVADPESMVEMADVDRSQPPPASRINLFADINGNVKPSGDRSDPQIMVGVGVGQDDSVDIPDVFPEAGHPSGRFAVAFSGIKQNGSAVRPDEATVAVASRSDDGQFHQYSIPARSLMPAL